MGSQTMKRPTPPKEHPGYVPKPTRRKVKKAWGKQGKQGKKEKK